MVEITRKEAQRRAAVLLESPLPSNVHVRALRIAEGQAWALLALSLPEPEVEEVRSWAGEVLAEKPIEPSCEHGYAGGGDGRA